MSAPIALVHDYLTQRGGAERVVLSLSRAFPDAAIHTSVYEAASTFPEFEAKHIVPAPMNRIALVRRRHRLGLPLYGAMFSRMVVDAEVAICSSSGWAHRAHVTGRKIVYCHAPARWLYQAEAYMGGSRRAGLFEPFRKVLARSDARAAASADVYLTNSRAVSARIRDLYGIAAEVVAPPHSLGADGPRQQVDGIDGGYFLCVSRLLPYKNVASVVGAFASLPHQLVVVGDGPVARSLRASATKNVRFLAGVTDAELRWLYASAQAVVAASFEDYGLTPVEASAFGTPSVVLRWGGFLDTVVEDKTGVFFDEPAPAPIAAAVRRLLADPPEAHVVLAHAEGFSEDAFVSRVREVAGAAGHRM